MFNLRLKLSIGITAESIYADPPLGQLYQWAHDCQSESRIVSFHNLIIFDSSSNFERFFRISNTHRVIVRMYYKMICNVPVIV